MTTEIHATCTSKSRRTVHHQGRRDAPKKTALTTVHPVMLSKAIKEWSHVTTITTIGVLSAIITPVDAN